MHQQSTPDGACSATHVAFTAKASQVMLLSLFTARLWSCPFKYTPLPAAKHIFWPLSHVRYHIAGQQQQSRCRCQQQAMPEAAVVAYQPSMIHLTLLIQLPPWGSCGNSGRYCRAVLEVYLGNLLPEQCELAERCTGTPPAEHGSSSPCSCSYYRDEAASPSAAKDI